MKILDEKRAPNPRRVRVFLAEKAVAVPYQDVDIMTGAHKSEAFARVNPVQRVPVLVLDDGTAICESMAICRYFEALQPEPSLLGQTPLEIGTIEMWNRIAEINFLFPVMHYFRHTHPAMASLEVPQVAPWAEANKPRISDIILTLDRRLSETPYLAGERFSVADITAMVATDFMKPARLAVPDGVPHFARWYADVAARPSSKA